MGKARHLRRRRSAHTGGAPQWSGLWLLGIGVYVIGAVALGLFFSDRLTGLNQAGAPQPTPQPVQASAQATPSAQPQAQIELTLPTVAVYAVGSDGYQSKADAGNAALLMIQRGAAGYILGESEPYRVLLSAYTTSEAAQRVADRLSASSDMQAQVVPIRHEGFTLALTAVPERLAAVEQSFTAYEEALGTLDGLWRTLDAGETAPVAAAASLRELSQRLNLAEEEAFAGTLIQGDAQTLTLWRETLEAMRGYVDAVADSQQSSMEISAKIKYTYLACVDGYGAYLTKVKTLMEP